MGIEVTFVGTAAATPQIDRRQSCIAIQSKNTTFIIDMGEAAQINLLKYKVTTSKKLFVLLTHLHSDHTLGLMGFLSSRNLINATNKLTLIGPPGTRKFFFLLCMAYKFFPIYPVEIIETTEEVILNTKDYRIESFLNNHSTKISLGYKLVFYPSCIGKFQVEKAKELGIPQGPLWGKLQNGYSIEMDEKVIKSSDVLEPSEKQPVSIVISGDTILDYNVLKKATEADLLIHEATYPVLKKDRAIKYKHSTNYDAALIAKLANVKKLAITHFAIMNDNVDREVNDLKHVYSNIIVTKDGLKLELKTDNC